MSQAQRFCLPLVLVFSPLALSAQGARDPHAVQPERPTVATHAGTVAPGWFEIEAGVERDRFSPSFMSTSTPTVAKIGIASHVQLSVFATTMSSSAGRGFGDLAIGPKIRLLDDAPFVGDFAILPAVKFGTGAVDRGTGTGTTDASLLLISSHDFGGVAMDLNAGYTRRSGDGSTVPKNASVWTASFGGPLSDPFGWVFECFGFPGTGGPAGQAPSVALLGGPTLLAHKWLAFDVGVIVPLTGPQPRALYAGGVYNVGRLWK